MEELVQTLQDQVEELADLVDEDEDPEELLALARKIRSTVTEIENELSEAAGVAGEDVNEQD